MDAYEPYKPPRLKADEEFIDWEPLTKRIARIVAGLMGVTTVLTIMGAFVTAVVQSPSVLLVIAGIFIWLFTFTALLIYSES